MSSTQINVTRIPNKADKLQAVIDDIFEAGTQMLKSKSTLTDLQKDKLKVMKTLSPHINASAHLISTEVAHQRNILVAERMKQLGYRNSTKALQ